MWSCPPPHRLNKVVATQENVYLCGPLEIGICAIRRHISAANCVCMLVTSNTSTFISHDEIHIHVKGVQTESLQTVSYNTFM